MRDTELYQHLLGLVAPWTVERVALDVAGGRVDVWAEHDKKARFKCPECSKECGLYDHDEERVWRHLDSCQFQTFLRARIPRVRCDEHGVRQARVPWAEPKSRFTMLFERLAIDVMLNMDLKNAARLLGLSWDEAHHIQSRAVARGLARREVAGIDWMKRPASTTWWHGSPTGQDAVRAASGGQPWRRLASTCTRLQLKYAF